MIAGILFFAAGFACAGIAGWRFAAYLGAFDGDPHKRKDGLFAIVFILAAVGCVVASMLSFRAWA